MSRNKRKRAFDLSPDTRGIIWDLLLYVPTVGYLLLWGLKLWYAGETPWMGYILLFLGFFFFMVGSGRILRRLQWLPTAPVRLEIEPDKVRVYLKNGEEVSLVKDVRFFPDHVGKSFGLSGMDATGERRQFVFHRNQFGPDEEGFAAATAALQPYKA